ncbi:alpha/beta hydrolase [Planctomycetaceae bacterium SH139]
MNPHDSRPTRWPGICLLLCSGLLIGCSSESAKQSEHPAEDPTATMLPAETPDNGATELPAPLANDEPNRPSAGSYGGNVGIGDLTGDDTGSSETASGGGYAIEPYRGEAASDGFADTPPRVVRSGSSIMAPSEQPRALTPKKARTNSLSRQPQRAEAASPSDLPSNPPNALPDDAPFAGLPTGATYSADDEYATVAVYYATDRAPDAVPLGSYGMSGERAPVLALIGFGSICFFVTVFSLFRGRSKLGAAAGLAAGGCALMAVTMVSRGVANIEKTGVTYTAERGVLTQGIAEVTVPASHERGKVERPSILRFEFAEDQSKHIVMTSATELNNNDFYRRMQASLKETSERELMVFIHGYNVDFESAVRRTAQLAVDLPFRGVPVCYSWPSQGTLLGYKVDENNVAWTVSHLRDFLTDLAARSGARSINLVAHSMGNRALTAALSEISLIRGNNSPPLFDRVVLAAPDIDADYFRRDLANRVLSMAEQVTLYASSNDRALIASKQVHGYPRAGDAGANIVVVPGIETIDVSGIDLSLLGHSYYGDSRAILTDLFELMHQRLPASQRQMLMPQQAASLIYWRIVGGDMAAGASPPIR